MTPLPPFLFLATLGLMALAQRRWPGGPWLVDPWTNAGFVPGAAGFVLGGWCLALFFRRRNALPPRAGGSRALITTGPYRFSRNPMYLSFALILCGAGLLLGGPGAVWGPPLFAWLVTRLWIVREESWLEDAFGAAYLDYVSRVRRWL